MNPLRETWKELKSQNWVPPHLRRVYPAAFTLFLVTLSVIIYPGSEIAVGWPGYALDAVGLVTAVLLFLGWWRNDNRLTMHGFWFGAGFWATAFVWTVQFVRGFELEIFIAGTCLGMLNLAVGAWWLIRKDPV